MQVYSTTYNQSHCDHMQLALLELIPQTGVEGLLQLSSKDTQNQVKRWITAVADTTLGVMLPRLNQLEARGG